MSQSPARLPVPFSFIERQLEAWAAEGVSRLDGQAEGVGVRELHIELTHRCNLRCAMCHHWEMPFDDPESVKREMGLDDIKKLVRDSERLKGVVIVVLTGGEPMIRQDIGEIAEFLAGRYPRASVGILSNFWNTELVRRRLLEMRQRGILDRVWLGSSLDGLEPSHDLVRGREGAFQGLVRTMGAVRREFPNTHFSFSFTITPKNYRELWPAYRFVTDEGLWFGAQMVVNHQGLKAPETFEWRPEELDEIERQINMILEDIAVREGALERIIKGTEREAQWLWSRLLYWIYLRKYARRPERFFRDCMAGQRYAMFDPEGNLFFCPVNKHRKIGNAREKGFDMIWTSGKASSEREYVASCQCDCWLNCIANPILDRVMAKAFSLPVAQPA